MATPTGLRYDTSDKDDLFSARLQDLETFQADYLNKNLRVQPRRGNATTLPTRTATPTACSCFIATSNVPANG